MLRYAASFAQGNAGLADLIEQRRLTVIDVTHDGDHRRPCDPIRGVFRHFDVPRGFFLVAHLSGDRAERAAEILGDLHFQRLVDGGEHLHVEEFLHQHGTLQAQLFGQFLHGDALGDGDLLIGRNDLLFPPLTVLELTLFLLLNGLARAGLSSMAARGIRIGSVDGRGNQSFARTHGRSGMHGTAAEATTTHRSAALRRTGHGAAGTAQNGLTGTNRAAMNGLARRGSAGAHGAGHRRTGRRTRRLRLRRMLGLTLMLQARDQVRPGRHHGTRGGLAGQAAIGRTRNLRRHDGRGGRARRRSARNAATGLGKLRNTRRGPVENLAGARRSGCGARRRPWSGDGGGRYGRTLQPRGRSRGRGRGRRRSHALLWHRRRRRRGPGLGRHLRRPHLGRGWPGNRDGGRAARKRGTDGRRAPRGGHGNAGNRRTRWLGSNGF